MDLSSLKNTPGARASRKRVGRGRASGMGKTSSRGHKGAQARAGYRVRLGFEGGQMPLLRRIPKRGFKNINRVVYCPVNVAALERFEDGTEVTPQLLSESGLYTPKYDGVKILGGGDLTRKLTVKVHGISATAKAKIEAAGGSVELI